MILLVIGDRHWKDRAKLGREIVRRKKKIKFLVHGGARGADLIADEYARLLGIQTVMCDANWTFYKRAAGPIRNSMQLKVAMALAAFLKEQLVVLAFHSNLKESKGTRDMIIKARRARVLVKIIK